VRTSPEFDEEEDESSGVGGGGGEAHRWPRSPPGVSRGGPWGPEGSEESEAGDTVRFITEVWQSLSKASY